MVLYTSDHGEMLGAHGMLGKSCLYEEAIRVPLLVRYPGVIESGLVVDAPVSTIDIAPTILQLVSLQSSDKDAWPWRKQFQGFALGNLLQNGVTSGSGQQQQQQQSWRTTASVTLTHARWYAIRTPEWKLIFDFQLNSSRALYFLPADPYEMHNLVEATAHADDDSTDAALDSSSVADKDNSRKDGNQKIDWHGGGSAAASLTLSSTVQDVEKLLIGHLHRFLNHIEITSLRPIEHWVWHEGYRHHAPHHGNHDNDDEER